MKTMFSIGETAKLMGISVQALRYYSKRGVLLPSYVNPETGYRYYSSSQFHLINRIKNLQNLGMSLADIADILRSGNTDYLLEKLIKQKEIAIQNLRQAQNAYEDINWYIDYFNYPKNDFPHGIPYKLKFGKRYLLVGPCYQNESTMNGYIRLNTIKNKPRFNNLYYYKWYVYLIDYKDMKNKTLNVKYTGLFLKEPPAFDSPYIIEIPAGNYICFKGRIRTEDWDPSLVIKCFEGRSSPKLVIACEYENSLWKFDNSTFEVQVLMGCFDIKDRYEKII